MGTRKSMQALSRGYVELFEIDYKLEVIKDFKVFLVWTCVFLQIKAAVVWND